MEQYIGGRYRLNERLGVGGMGVVHLALDRLTRQQVAVKQVSLPGGTDEQDFTTTVTLQELRLALTQEFKFLASLRHPNIVSVLDYGFDQEQRPYFVMEWLPSALPVTLAARSVDASQRTGYVVQMLQALSYLHRNGILHRDLKPDNVLVSNDRVRLLDFGLSVSKHGTQLQGATAGTLQYMAPELLNGDSPSVESDLFAVGVIAYEMAAGRHPFFSDDIYEMLDRIVGMPVPLDYLTTPQAETAIIERLLRKQPADRFHTAQEALLALQGVSPVEIESPTLRESYIQASRFIGRQHEINRLNDALRQAQDGHGTILLLGGESGVGKTRLLDEFGTLARVAGAVVARSQATSEGSAAYELWKDVIARLTLTADMDTATLATLSLISPDIGLVLGRTLDEPTAQPATRNEPLKERLQNALVTLFRQQPQPVVVLLDDLHLAGSGLDVLKRLALIIHELGLVIVAAYRTDEYPTLPDELPEAEHLRLGRLSETETALLLDGIIGRVEPDLVGYLHRETEGNTYFLVEAVRTLADEAGSLDNIHATSLPTQIFTGGVQQFIERRLSRVSAAALPLLRVAAAIGRVVELNVLKLIYPSADTERWLFECTQAAIFEVQDAEWRFSHDKVREGILGRLTPDDRRQLYTETGAALEQLHATDPAYAGRIAYHWSSAGNTAKELQFRVIAGEYFLKVSLFGDALQHAARALDLTAQHPVTPGMRLRIKSVLARGYQSTGDLDLARPLVQECITLAEAQSQPRLQIDFMLILGEMLRRQGDLEDGQQLLRKAHQLATDLNDRERIAAALLAQVTPILNVELHEASRIAQQALDLYRQIGDEVGMARASYRLALSLADPADAERVKDLLEFSRERFNAKDHGPAFLDVSRMLIATLMEEGGYERAQQLAEEGLHTARVMGSKSQTGALLQIRGQIGLRIEDFALAESFLRESIAIFRSMRDIANLAFALAALGEALLRRGDVSGSEQTLEESIALSRQQHLAEVLTIAFVNRAKLYAATGHMESAWHLLREALHVVREEGLPSDELYILDAAIGLLQQSTEYERLATVAAFVVNSPTVDSSIRKDVQQALDTALRYLPPSARDAVVARGQALSIEQALNMALGNAPLQN